MTITGDLKVMIDALGHSLQDQRVVDAMAIVGLPVERDEFQVGSTRRVYYLAEQELAEFILEDDVLWTVIVHTQPDEEHGAYPRPDALVEGLSGTAAREEVLARFGEPEWTNGEADRFRVDGAYVRFGYLDDRVAKVTVMSKVPGQ